MRRWQAGGTARRPPRIARPPAHPCRFRIYDTPAEAFKAAPTTGPAAVPVPADALPAALRVRQGELIYDYAWFPLMSALDPATCCFASTSRAHPVHLWDACSGEG